MKIINLPEHVAIIMDGNGRWAVKRGLKRTAGHKQGVVAMKRVVNCAIKRNVKILSLFAFSTENWSREKDEVNYILSLIEEYAENTINEFLEKNIKFVVMGDLQRFDQKFIEKIQATIDKTKNCDGLILNIGLNYGGRDEILIAVNKLLEEGKKQVSIDDFIDKLQTKQLSDPDLIIRPSGEQRLSNFMLFQCAYSELLFPKRLWPDFSERDFDRALKIYSKRNRRFGKIYITGEKK